MIIDCDSCEVRGLACGDCVVTALLGSPPTGVELDDGERAALDTLAESGLVPPLRLVTAVDASTGGCRCKGSAPFRANAQISGASPACGGAHSVAAG